MDQYVDGEYLRKHPDWHASDSPWKAEKVIALLERNELSPASIAEVGCGFGRVLTQLAETLGSDRRFIGYDISPQAIEMACSNNSNGVDFYCADITRSDACHFDLILALDVFEHVEDPFTFLRRLASKADWFAFHIPLDMYALALLIDHQTAVHNRFGHLHYYSKATALQTLRDCGYDIVDHFYTRHGVELPDREVPFLRRMVMKTLRRSLYWLNKDLSVKLVGGCSLMVLARPSQ